MGLRSIASLAALACFAGCVQAIPLADRLEESDAGEQVVQGLQVDLAHEHTCVLTEDGSVYCWGGGSYGEIGHGDLEYYGVEELPSSLGPVSLGARAVQITTGEYHSCTLLEDGRVRCWGRGEFGTLGIGSLENIGDDELPTAVSPIELGGRAVQISAGGAHTCAVLEGGELRCWGAGGHGALGYGNTEDVGDDEEPWTVGSVDVGGPVIQVSAGWETTCALLEDGSVRCWGRCTNCVLGNQCDEDIGDDELPSSVEPVELGGRAVQITAAHPPCALLADGTVRCWGRDPDDYLGYGNTEIVGDDERPADVGPVDVGGRVVQIASGGPTCALLEGGSVRCWGSGAGGQLGYGNEETIGDDELPSSVGPVDVGGPVVRIAVADHRVCAVLDDDELRCWGWNYGGELGYGNNENIGDDETPASAGDVQFR